MALDFCILDLKAVHFLFGFKEVNRKILVDFCASLQTLNQCVTKTRQDAELLFEVEIVFNRTEFLCSNSNFLIPISLHHIVKTFDIFNLDYLNKVEISEICDIWLQSGA